MQNNSCPESAGIYPQQRFNKTISFMECLDQAVETPDLVKEFDRLTGHNLSRRGAPIELMVDDATHRTDAGIKDFIGFVYDCVYTRLP